MLENAARPLRPGDACPCMDCSGRIQVYATRINFALAVRVRYLHCPACGAEVSRVKWVLPLEFAPARTNGSTNTR